MNLKTFLLLIVIIGTQYALRAEGDGFGENPGGAGGDTVFVDNKDDLKHYAGLTGSLVIFVKDTIDVGSDLRLTSFKTLSGIDSTSTILGNINIKSGVNNVVVKNLNISNPANDGITIRNAQYVYVTNCTVYDCGDGCIDITVESDFVTVSYCRFYYKEVLVHKFVNLIGASDDDTSDRGKLHVTMHHNWWDTGCTSRMPRVRFGRVHVYNNYFSCVGNNYCNRAAIEAELFSERNYFNGVRDPLTTDQDGKAKSLENEYVNCEGTTHPGTDDVFTPSYNYTSASAIEAREEVIEYAGNKKRDVEDNLKIETKIDWENPDNIIYGTPLSEVQLNATATGNTSTPVYSHQIGTVLPGGYQTLTVTFPEDENYKEASKTVTIKVNYEYFSLDVNTIGATSSDLIEVSPAGETINGELMFIKDTEVKLTAFSNLVSEFDSWHNGSTTDTFTVVMTEDKAVSAYYNTLDYVVAWDLYTEGSRNRVADFYSSEVNKNALLKVIKEGGYSVTFMLYSEENKLLGKNAAMIGRGASSAGDYYFQVEFNASSYKNIQVSANMLGLNTYYQVQNVEYSIDGINYIKAGEFNLEQDSVWFSNTFQLPEDANGSSVLIVRFKADKNSALVSNGTIGTSISEIIILADDIISSINPITESDLKIVETQYYTIDGKRIKTPVKGVNIVRLRFEDGSISTKKVFYSKAEGVSY